MYYADPEMGQGGGRGFAWPWEDPEQYGPPALPQTDGEWKDYVRAVFKSDALNVVVVRQSVESLAAAAGVGVGGTVDLELVVSDPVSFSDNDTMGVSLFPSGSVLMGATGVRQGQRYIVRGVPVQSGQEVLVALDDRVPVQVQAHAPGWQPPREDPKSPLSGYYPLIVLAFLVVAWLLFHEYNKL